MREYDLYLFDFDNTLYDTSEGIKEILKQAFPAAGREYSDDLFLETLGLSMDQVFDRFIGDRDLYGRFCDEFMRIVRTEAYKTAVPFPETADVLMRLRDAGKHVGIASGKMSYKIVDLLEAHGLYGYVETVVGYHDTERHKPDPAPIELAFSRFDVPLERTVYIGDSPNDGLAAKAAGMDCLIVNRRNGMTPDGIECTEEIGSLSEIICW